MTPHPIQQYFEARRNALIQLSEAVVHTHSGTAGAAREMLIRELLTSHLPPVLIVGTGLVFGHEWAHRGNKEDISTQQDVVIYRSDFPVLEVGGAPLFFRESVVATIEVKTNYESTKLSTLMDNASSVRRVRPAPVATFQMGSSGPFLRSDSRRVLCGVFYFRGLKTRTALVHELNLLLESRAAKLGCPLEEVNAPDFFFSPQAGLIVRKSEFNVLREDSRGVAGLDDVSHGLGPDEKAPGAYRRAFGDAEKWRALQVIILELAERCQRYAASYASLSEYV